MYLHTFFIDQQIDSGAIIKQEKIILTDKTTAAELHNTLMNKGSDLLINEFPNYKEIIETKEKIEKI